MFFVKRKKLCIFFGCLHIFIECTDTSTMSDNCTTTRSGRKKYEDQTGVQATGCASHGANTMNEGLFKLDKFKTVQKKMDAAINSMRNSTFGGFVKDEVIRSEIIEEKKAIDKEFDPSLHEMEIKAELKARRMKESNSIPNAGNTRQWNNQYKGIDWILARKDSILQLYVILFVYMCCICFCCV